jgi:prepilin-type processing-associated H-X9-DG protein
MAIHNLAVAILFQNHGMILFADGHIVHTNVDPEPIPWMIEHVQAIAAQMSVLEAAAHIKDAAVRAEIQALATKDIEVKTAELARGHAKASH